MHGETDGRTEKPPKTVQKARLCCAGKEAWPERKALMRDAAVTARNMPTQCRPALSGKLDAIAGVSVAFQEATPPAATERYLRAVFDQVEAIADERTLYVQEAVGLGAQPARWKLDPLRDGVIFIVAIVVLLLVGLIYRRLRWVFAHNTHVPIPHYLDPQSKITVPLKELRKEGDNQLYAIDLEDVTLVVKVYLRRVKF